MKYNKGVEKERRGAVRSERLLSGSGASVITGKSSTECSKDSTQALALCELSKYKVLEHTPEQGLLPVTLRKIVN